MVIEPGLSDSVRRMFLRLSDYFTPLVPDRPTRLFAKPTATLPDPAKFKGAIMFDETANAPVWSDGSNWLAF